MCDFTDIISTVELPIGTRFYFRGCLYEVVELGGGKWDCSQCEFDNRYDEAICEVMNCDKSERHDGKYVYFNEVKEDSNE